MTGLPTRLSVRFTVATSSLKESRPYWTAITSCPSDCSAGITLLKHEPSAQMPWQKTMVGLSDMLHLQKLVTLRRIASPFLVRWRQDLGSSFGPYLPALRNYRPFLLRPRWSECGFTTPRSSPRRESALGLRDQVKWPGRAHKRRKADTEP